MNDANNENGSAQEVSPEINESDKTLEPDKLLLEKLQKLSGLNLKLEADKDELENKVSEFERIHGDLKVKYDRCQQQIDSAKKELQSMVMKYATSEREVLNVKKHLTESEKKFKESLKEREQLQIRIRDLTNEKKQLISSVERHVLESANLKTESDLAKNRLDQSHVREEKLQLQLQNVTADYEALKSKVDMIESSIAKLPKLSQSHTKYSLNDEDDLDDLHEPDPSETEEHLSIAKEERESISRPITPEKESPVNTDYTAVFQQVLQTNERLLKEKNYYHEQNSELEGKIEELQNRLAEACAKSDDYSRKLMLIDELKDELIKKQNVVDSLKQKFDQINSINRSLVGDIDTSKSKESELLEYTERLTAKLVSLQSGSNGLETKLKECQQNFDDLQKDYDSIISTKNELQTKLEQCRQEYENKVQSSASEFEAVTSENLMLRRKVEELENDIAIAKKKHFSALKEMTVEIQKLRKSQGPNQSNNLSHNDLVTNSSLSSRTGSISSLNNEPLPILTNHVQSGACSENHSNDHSTRVPAKDSCGELHNSTTNEQQESRSVSDVLPPCDITANQEIITSLSQVKKSVLIEKLLKLQRILVKRKEKIDFLEEHSEQLTHEISNKTKLLQHYILKEETGTLATDSMDQNKAYLSKRGGGIMSSLYNTFSTDDSMTLERSLEINAKLHALLEDTLLKNMTLKENLNTLATEIDRLSAK